MSSQTKYMVAGSIIAGVGTIYALQKNVDVNLIAQKVEDNKGMFFDIIEELVSMAAELLEKIVLFIKKMIKKIIFQVKMNLAV